MVRKYWLETLMGIAAAIGVIGITVYLNMTAIHLWWAANWWWVVGIIALVTSKWWLSPISTLIAQMWQGYVAISDRVDMKRIRQQHYLMLADSRTQMRHGFDLEYHNQPLGFQIKVHNPYLKAGMTKVAEVAAQSQGLLGPGLLPKAPVYREVDSLITDQKLVLCYTQDGPVFGTVADLLSMCVVGKPGRGKSTALLYYILILLKAGAEVWIWDPHSGLNELAYGLNYSDDLGDIENSCPKLHAILEQRRKLWKEQKQVMHPLLLLVDEMPVIADYENDRLKELKGQKEDLLEFDQLYRPSRLLKKFVLEARKWNCYVILSGQALPAEVLSTLTRDNMSSRIVFESCNMHAKMAGLQKEQIDNLLPSLKGAGPGVAVMDVSRWSQPVLAAIPNTTVNDLRAFIDGGRIVESDRDTDPLSAVPRFKNWPDLSSNEVEGSAVPENIINWPGERAETTADGVPSFGSEDYLLNDLQIELFSAHYQDCGNITESLSRIKNDKGQGLGRRYFKHASWIVKSKGLRRA